jgi:hypothetical protein
MMVGEGRQGAAAMRQLDPNAGFVTAGIVDVTDAQGIPDEEWFGPLLQIVRVKDFDSGVKVANATEFGLAAALLSPSEELWKRFSRARARRHRQLEPSDHGRRQLGAVRRRRQVGQPPPKRLLRGGLLRLPGRLDRDGRTRNAGQAVAGTGRFKDTVMRQRSRIQLRWPGRPSRTTTPASRSGTSRPSAT